jgi:hypothetical protein
MVVQHPMQHPMRHPMQQDLKALPSCTSTAQLERLQFWVGLDCETEWFEVPVDGVSVSKGGVFMLSAMPDSCTAVARSTEVRFRAIFRVDRAPCEISLGSDLAPGASVVLRDAFGTDMLQVIPGIPACVPTIAFSVESGRYSVDAHLTESSSISVKLRPAVAATKRVRTKSRAG